MNEIQLSRDADALICVLYREYLNRRKSGVSKSSAKSFGEAKTIHDNFMPKWSVDDVNETCLELCRADLLSCFCANNIVSESTLTDEAIIYMENRFKDGLSALLKYLEKFVPFLFG